MREVAETTNRRTHTDGTTTVTLAAHVHRGLITIIIVFVWDNYSNPRCTCTPRVTNNYYCVCVGQLQ